MWVSVCEGAGFGIGSVSIMVSLLDNLMGVDSGASCPRVQIYNDGTGLVIEYPWFTR